MINKEQIDVSVVIVNYNTKQMTFECIESVLKFTKSISIEIILVDNFSSDGSRDFFSKYSGIKYIYLEENIGFGRANNRGASIALGKYLFFLNSDTLLLANVLNKLLSFFESNFDKNIGAIGTCLIDADGNDSLSFLPFVSINRIYQRLVEQFLHSSNKSQSSVYNSLKDNYFAKVDVISGANLFIPTIVFNKLMGFDSDFFMYYEETDLQMRMHLLKLNRFIINERDIIHYDGGSFENKSVSVNRILMMNNSLKLYIDKHFRGFGKRHLKFLFLLILIRDLFRFKYSISNKLVILKAFMF
jgi:GT2 family glycosyltransferase